jgi:hypothetical protein
MNAILKSVHDNPNRPERHLMNQNPLKISLTMLARPTLLLLLALALAPVAARAQNSQYMSYQGYLTDGGGNPLGSTNTGPKAYDVVFRIWDLQTGGTIGSADELFAELQTVTVDNGYFSVLLGQGSTYTGSQTEPHGPLSGVFTTLNAPRYVEMTVLGIGVGGANVTILPRLQLVYAPYALLAVNAVNAANVTGTNVITAANLSTNLGLWQAIGPSYFPPGSIYYPTGNVGIGTTTPQTMLDVNGSGRFNGPVFFNYSAQFENGAVFANLVSAYAGAMIATNKTLEFGLPYPKEQNAGKIGYETFSGDSLDIVGAGTNVSSRKIKFWAEGGATFTGDVTMQGGASNNVVFAAGGDEDLRIVRGVVNYDGTIASGAGFTIQHAITGGYQINFNKSFSDTPAVTVTLGRDSSSSFTGAFPIYYGVTSNYASLYLVNANGAFVSDHSFHFIAIGRR